MMTNEEAIYNALKRRWGSELTTLLTPNNLKVEITGNAGYSMTGNIYAGSLLVAENQTWTKSEDDLNRIKLLPPPRIPPFELATAIHEGTFDGVYETGVFWDENNLCLVVYTDTIGQEVELLEQLKGSTILGDIGIYPRGARSIQNGDNWSLSLYYHPQDSDFCVYPIPIVFYYEN